MQLKGKPNNSKINVPKSKGQVKLINRRRQRLIQFDLTPKAQSNRGKFFLTPVLVTESIPRPDMFY